MNNNPFDITKAVDYTDEQLYENWVDIYEHGFYHIINPESLMPMIIVGCKGSGKTHVMKYFSYELQKISGRLHVTENQDKFIGVYIRCSGFNADKFSGRGVPDDVWGSLYAYYWELWIGERITSILIDLQNNKLVDRIDEASLVNSVLNLFTKNTVAVSNLAELRSYFLSLQKNVEYEVQNFIFKAKKMPEVELLIPVSKLSYGYPEILKESIPFFKDKYILYLIDELENFSEKQQELIQTLLREKSVACTFRIGTRPYGIRTYKTLGGMEENHDGSEFQKIVLDDKLRSRGEDEYEKYIAKICERRLINSGFPILHDFTIENYIEEQSNDDTIAKVFMKKESQSRSFICRLEKNLKHFNNSSLSETDINDIMSNLRFKENLLLERINAVLFYRCIKNGGANLLKDAREIKKSAALYYATRDKETQHFKFLEKFRQDMIDSIAKDGRVDISYYGFKKLAKLSCGTPRTMLRLLKSAFNAQCFETGKRPFVNGVKLSIRAQKGAIESTYNWFFEENRIPASTSNRAVDAVVRLGQYLQALRFSDVPPQCSINIFTASKENMSNSARATFELLERYSYFVKTDERRIKNTVSKNSVYMLNSILIPKWELALAKRGMIELSSEDAEFIFNLDKKDDFKNFLAKKIKQYMFPFARIEKMNETQEFLLL